MLLVTWETKFISHVIVETRGAPRPSHIQPLPRLEHHDGPASRMNVGGLGETESPPRPKDHSSPPRAELSTTPPIHGFFHSLASVPSATSTFRLPSPAIS